MATFYVSMYYGTVFTIPDKLFSLHPLLTCNDPLQAAAVAMSTFTHQPSPGPEEALKKDLLMLEAQRDALELEADAIASELKSPGTNGEPPVGVKGPLVDSDGYPFAGVDLFNVRAKRHR